MKNTKKIGRELNRNQMTATAAGMRNWIPGKIPRYKVDSAGKTFCGPTEDSAGQAFGQSG